MDSVLTNPTGAKAKNQVAILLGTKDGERFLAAQLDSIASQTHTDWHVYASDDGSADGTQQLLKQYQARWGSQRLSLYNSPRADFAANDLPTVGSEIVSAVISANFYAAQNFLSLISNPEINAAFYAYADQDDLWHPHKLARALRWMQGVPADRPALYCTRTQLIDEHGNDLGLSPLYRRSPSFANALVQCIAGGNTMVFNQRARQLLCYLDSSVKVISHDWWTYLLIAGNGGTVFYDPIPSVSYRQHRDNLVGSNRRWLARLSRARKLLSGRFRYCNDFNLQALQAAQAVLTVENHQLLEQFCMARARWWPLRVLAVWRCGIYRQRPLDNAGLVLANLLGKL